MDGLRAWARQPTTIAGFSAAIAAVSALLLKQLTLAQVIPVLAGAVASMVLPDNTQAQARARDLAGDVVCEFSTGKAAGQ